LKISGGSPQGEENQGLTERETRIWEGGKKAQLEKGRDQATLAEKPDNKGIIHWVYLKRKHALQKGL